MLEHLILLLAVVTGAVSIYFIIQKPFSQKAGSAYISKSPKVILHRVCQAIRDTGVPDED